MSEKQTPEQIPNDSPLEEEIKLFNKLKPELLRKHPLHYVLIKEGKVEVFEDLHEAVKTGGLKYGHTGSFLVRRLLPPSLEKPAEFPALTHGLLNANF